MRESIRMFYYVLLQWQNELNATRQYLDMIMVEGQFHAHLAIIEGAALMFGFANCLPWKVLVVHPRVLKRVMGIKYTKNHYQNKKEVSAKIQSLGYGMLNHNIADAMLLCLYGAKMSPNFNDIKHSLYQKL